MAYGKTAQLGAAISRAVFRHAWLLVLCLLTASVVVTTTSHARESDGVAQLSCDGAQHADGDADQVPADSDQSVPHHHGTCHGHNLVTASATSAHLPAIPAQLAPNGRGTTPMGGLTLDPVKEPPRV